VRRVIRPLVWSLLPRFSRSLPDDADRWLNTPLHASMRALYARRLPVSLLYGENDIVEVAGHPLGDLARATAGDPMIWFLLATAAVYLLLRQGREAVTLLVSKRIQAFAEQLRTPPAHAESTASAVVRPAGDPAVT
jgi:hypothetical protein